MSNNILKPKIGAVILAAGLGKRMNSIMLKVMHLLNGKPLIDYAVATVEKAELGRKPTIVVCNDDPSVQNFLGARADYVVQWERLGTGHAVSVAESNLKGEVDQVVVLYGDMPFIKSESVQRLVQEHVNHNNTLTLMTVTVPNFTGWYQPFDGFGRIIRDEKGDIINNVEKKDCTSEQAKVTEVNPCIYCFKSEWLWDGLKKIKNNNAQQEYYLTDLIQIAIEQGKKISSISIEPKEAVGINSQDDLKTAENLI